MTVSMRVMSAGNGYRYLLNTVVVGDGARDYTEPLTRYYAEKGTPPGFWLGSGLRGIGGGQVRAGQEIREAQLRLLLGLGCDPMTGAPLGKPWPQYAGLPERIAARVAKLPAALSVDERAEAATVIEAQEQSKGQRAAVAGFDHTFSVPKSVSALWAVADGGTQALIVQAHHEAIADVLGLLERDVAMTRVGSDAGSGSVAQVEVRGIVAAAYDHYDSRSSDPQLHTHVVVSNKVQGAHDHRWRAIDGRPIHAAVVALSEHYNSVLADHLARSLGLAWDVRDRGPGRSPAFELASVPDALISEFSSRSHDIDVEADRLIAAYTAEHGRRPSKRIIIRLRAQATLSTRPDKTLHSLAELTEQWRARATIVLGEDAPSWAATVLRGQVAPVLLRADDLPLETLDEIGRTVVDIVGQERATWRRWNLYAEAARQLREFRFASTADREAVTALVADAAEHASIRLTPPELAHTPALFQRPDGSSVFRPKHGALLSSAAMLEAEDRLLALAADTTGPGVEIARVDRATGRPLPDGNLLSPDQVAAVLGIALSGRKVDALVGPAGTGKTTTLAALRRAWESEHGRGSVIGLAPSAAAAAVLAGELRIATENTAKWAYEHRAGRWDFRRDQLVIVDEASIAGTFILDALTAHAAAVGAKTLLVGDWAQLDAVESSGAFAMIANALDDAPELVEVWRFRAAWEKRASLGLRLGETEVLKEYLKHGRIHDGDAEDMLDAAYQAWRTDSEAGLSSLMIAETTQAVMGLNLRARLDRIQAGQVHPERAVRLHDGTDASRGDTIVTRRNQRRLRTGRRWVKNGDLWQVVEAHRDGSLTVRRATGKGGMVRLPAGYAAESVELAYAITAYRAQGSTVETAHAIISSPSMTREALYVAMTRGRGGNAVYVATDQAHLEDHQRRPDAPAMAVLAGILARRGAEPSAHEAIAAEQEAWSNIAQLVAEYETIAQAAQRDRWAGLLAAAGLSAGQVEAITEGDSFGPLAAELRRAEANHHDPQLLLSAVVAERSLDGAADTGAVLRHRIQQAITPRTGSTRPQRAPRLIAGLIPEAVGIVDEDMRRGLEDRKQLILQRARALAEAAVADRAPWLRELGTPPAAGQARRNWLRHAATVACYRDRHAVTAATALGGEPASTVQRIDAARAQAAINRARALTGRTAPASSRGADRAPARQL